MDHQRSDCHVKSQRLRRLIVATALMLHIAMCAWGAWRHSPTLDEPAYLAAGLSHWEFGRFDLCRVSPPLVRIVAGKAVRLLARPKLNWKRYYVAPGHRSEHDVGHDLLEANGPNTLWLFTLGRWSCIPFSLLGACVSYRWARELFGDSAGIMALLLWCFSPNILAHAQLLTPDIGVSSLCLMACYRYYWWAKSPTWLRAGLAGFVLGLAVLAKTNAIVLFPTFVVAVGLNAIGSTKLRCSEKLFQGLFSLAVAIYTINLGYGFEGSLKPLRDYEFVSHTFAGDVPDKQTGNRFRHSWIGKTPVPLPAAFLEGIDLQRKDFENTDAKMKTYFRGRWYNHGWWWYYLYVILVKVPIGTVLLTIAGTIAVAVRQHSNRRVCLLYIILPGSTLFLLPCTQTGFGHSLRYILPAFPFAFLMAGATGSFVRSRHSQIVCSGILCSTIVSSCCVYPHCFSYFNETSGGPKRGHFHLLDGNVDWGQDVIYIREWVDSQKIAEPVYVAIWSPLQPKTLNWNISEPRRLPTGEYPPGWYVISVNHLRHEYRAGRADLDSFNTQIPVNSIGYSTRIYQVR